MRQAARIIHDDGYRGRDTQSAASAPQGGAHGQGLGMLKLGTSTRSTYEVRRLDRQPRMAIEQCNGMQERIITLKRSRCSSDTHALSSASRGGLRCDVHYIWRSYDYTFNKNTHVCEGLSRNGDDMRRQTRQKRLGAAVTGWISHAAAARRKHLIAIPSKHKVAT